MPRDNKLNQLDARQNLELEHFRLLLLQEVRGAREKLEATSGKDPEFAQVLLDVLAAFLETVAQIVGENPPRVEVYVFGEQAFAEFMVGGHLHNLRALRQPNHASYRAQCLFEALELDPMIRHQATLGELGDGRWAAFVRAEEGEKFAYEVREGVPCPVDSPVEP